jgi:hypothetical protein
MKNNLHLSFQGVVDSFLKDFGLGREHKDLFLRVQRNKLDHDVFIAQYGRMPGLVLFMERENNYEQDLKELHTAQSSTKEGRTLLEQKGLLEGHGAIVIPSTDVEGNINRVFLLDDAPKEIRELACKLDGVIKGSKESEVTLGIERS